MAAGLPLQSGSRASHSNQAPGTFEGLMLLLIIGLQAGYSFLESSCPHPLVRHRKKEKATSLQPPSLAPFQWTQLM